MDPSIANARRQLEKGHRAIHLVDGVRDTSRRLETKCVDAFFSGMSNNENLSRIPSSDIVFKWLTNVMRI